MTVTRFVVASMASALLVDWASEPMTLPRVLVIWVAASVCVAWFFSRLKRVERRADHVAWRIQPERGTKQASQPGRTV